MTRPTKEELHRLDTDDEYLMETIQAEMKKRLGRPSSEEKEDGLFLIEDHFLEILEDFAVKRGLREKATIILRGF